MKKIIKILFLILLNSSTVFAQYQYPTAEQLHNFQGGGGIGIPITCSLGEQYFPISPQLRSTVDNFNLAMGVIGISHVGRGLYHFGANLADNTKLALANNESIRAIVTAKFLDWKVSITNLDNLNEAEKILIQEGRIAELRMVDGINSKLTDADFTSLEKQWDGWRLMGVNGAGSLFSKLDNLGLTVLKTEINLLDDVAKAKFLDEFAGASDDALRALNENTSLVNYWKANGNFIKNKTYPNVGHKAWDDTKNAIIVKADPIEIKILNAIENQFSLKPLTNNQPVMAGAYCDDIGGNVVVKYNLTPTEKASFNYNNLDPIIKEHIDYLNFIRQDALKNGTLYEKLYTGVSKDKLIAAGDAASHAEILALDEVVKSMRAQGKFSSRADLSNIQILGKGKGDWGNMCRCPHCYQLSNGVKMIGNE